MKLLSYALVVILIISDLIIKSDEKVDRIFALLLGYAGLGKMSVNKVIVGFGLVFWIAGVAFLMFSVPEEYVEDVEVDVWNLQSRTLAPSGEAQNSTFYGRYMGPGMSFKFNVSASGSVELRVSIVRHDPDSITQIHSETGTYFNSTMGGFQGGSYLVEIENQSLSWVTLEGNVLVGRSETNYRDVYPYAIPGALVIFGGTGVCIYGIFKGTSKSGRGRVKGTS